MKKMLLSLVAATLLGACAKNESDEAAVADSAMTGGQPAPAATGAVTDPQIAAIVVAANDVDIKAAEAAKAKSTNSEVKAFANQMITDHTGVNKAAVALVTKLNVTPEENPVSQQTRNDGEAKRQSLETMSGAAFDRAYIDEEVRYHQWLLTAIDETLLPSAQNAELKALLEQTRPAVVAHLDHAKKLQGSLGTQQ